MIVVAVVVAVVVVAVDGSAEFPPHDRPSVAPKRVSGQHPHHPQRNLETCRPGICR